MGIVDDLGLKPGVLVGEDVTKLLQYAKDKEFAIPAFNCTSSSTINAVMEAGAKTKSPVMIQISNGGGVFYCGKFVSNTNERACIAGCLAAAHHVHQLAEMYGSSSSLPRSSQLAFTYHVTRLQPRCYDFLTLIHNLTLALVRRYPRHSSH